ncbi:hypothetical protein ACTA71_007904 [Dictyostelium dimigraforme]
MIALFQIVVLQAPESISPHSKYDNLSSELTYGENLGFLQFGMNQLVQFKCYAKLVILILKLLITSFTSTLPNNCKDISTIQNENSTEIIAINIKIINVPTCGFPFLRCWFLSINSDSISTL